MAPRLRNTYRTSSRAGYGFALPRFLDFVDHGSKPLFQRATHQQCAYQWRHAEIRRKRALITQSDSAGTRLQIIDAVHFLEIARDRDRLDAIGGEFFDGKAHAHRKRKEQQACLAALIDHDLRAVARQDPAFLHARYEFRQSIVAGKDFPRVGLVGLYLGCGLDFEAVAVAGSMDCYFGRLPGCRGRQQRPAECGNYQSATSNRRTALSYGHWPPAILLQDTASMRSSATRANSASRGGTLIWLTTLPSARFSSVQARCCGSMRAMVEHMHTTGDMNWISLPCGLNSSAMRLTRFSSVPTNQRVFGGAAAMVLMIVSVDPT